jgi:hypothetical protein
MKFLLFILLFLPILSVYAQTADFLLSSQPEALIIYNKYQQKIPESGRRQFPPRTPWRIVEEFMFLSDQYTPVLKLSYNNDIYFIELDENRKIRGATGFSPPEVSVFRNCQIITDTLQVTDSEKIALRFTPDRGKIIILLKKDQLMQIVFGYRDYYFVHTLGGELQYGWIKKTQSVFWKKVELQKDKITITLPETLRHRVRNRMEEVNELYARYFQWMNRRYDKSLTSPWWQIESTENSILCKLNDIRYADDINESTRYLIQEFEGYLIGTPFKISTEPGTIRIHAEKD